MLSRGSRQTRSFGALPCLLSRACCCAQGLRMSDVKHVAITGASSGLGAALAREYAAPGVRLSLGGRNEERLRSVAEACRARGAQVEAQFVDVTDAPGVEAWIKEAEARAPIDLVLANAGVSDGTGTGGETKAQALEIFGTNLHGVLNTIFPVLPFMKARGRGQVAIMSSLAGFRGLPGAPAYCASKAAVRVYGEALRGELAPLGVAVNVICPGFVQTPMTDVNDFPMPFLMSADKAARIIRKGLDRNKGRIAFPWPMTLLVQLLGLLPQPLYDHLAGGLPRKPGGH